MHYLPLLPEKNARVTNVLVTLALGEECEGN